MRAGSIAVLLALAGLVRAGVCPPPAAAQDNAVQAYYGAVADHFGLPSQEVRILSQWSIQPEEVPVVLFLARHGGVSPDAVMALRRGGRGWAQLARSYGLDATTFHVALDASASAGPLAGFYEAYRSAPPGGKAGVTLGDADVTALVNVRVLSAYFGVPPGRVLAAREESDSFVAVYSTLLRSGG